MRQLTLFLIALLLLVGCSVDEIYLVVVNPETHTPAPTIQNPTETDTPIATNTPTPTLPPTITSSPIPPTNTPTPTQAGTIDPTPTRESLIQIRLNANSNIRTSPPESAFIRVAPLGTVFTVFSQRSASGVCITQWLDIGNGEWLCNGSWVTFISGNIDDVPFSQISQASRLGLNINGVAIPDINYLRQHIGNYEFATMLVMDNIFLACELANEYPDAIIIHRDYSLLEGEEWDIRSNPQDWLNRWRGEGCFNVVRYLTNEPSLYDIQRFANAEVELMDLAAQEGIRLAVGNFAVGSSPDWAIQGGIFDEWLRAIVRGNHFIGHHEYTTGILPFGVGVYSRQQLLDPQAMHPDNWVTNLPVAYVPFSAQAELDPVTSPFGLYEQSIVARPLSAQAGCGQLPSYWHILRATWFILRAECIGLNPDDIQIINTEGLWDNLSDIDIPEIQPIQTWRQTYGLPQYLNDMRGINSYQKLWAAYYPQWTQAEAALCQLIWWNYVVPDNYIGVNIFTWSTNEFWISFDMSGVQAGYLFELHRLIEQWANGQDMRPVCGNYVWAA